jgi:hypothetical protein
MGILADAHESSAALQQLREELHDIVESGIRSVYEAKDYIDELEKSFADVYTQLKPGHFPRRASGGRKKYHCK